MKKPTTGPHNPPAAAQQGSAEGQDSFLLTDNKETAPERPPKFKTMAEVHLMSQEGLDRIKKELAEALAQRPVISAAIAEAREKGDLSENAEYESAREAQGLLEMKIANLQNMIVNAKVLDSSQLSTEKVQMLNRVKVKNLNSGREMEFTIVGESEADFSKGKLAATTPIAKALLGHGKGETVEAKAPSGVIKFEILDISL